MKSQENIAADIQKYGVLGHMHFLFESAVYEAESLAASDPLMTLPLSREQIESMSSFENRVDKLRRTYEKFHKYNKKVADELEENFQVENKTLLDIHTNLKTELDELLAKYQMMTQEIESRKSAYLESCSGMFKDANRVVELHKVACDIYLREIKKIVPVPDDNDVMYNKDMTSVVFIKKIDLRKIYEKFVSTHLKGALKDIILSAYDVIASTEDKEELNIKMIELANKANSSLNSGDGTV